MSSKLSTPTMQMKFSWQIILLSFSSIPFINMMISKTQWSICWALLYQHHSVPCLFFGYWVSFPSLDSSLYSGWKMKTRNCLHKVIVCPIIKEQWLGTVLMGKQFMSSLVDLIFFDSFRSLAKEQPPEYQYATIEQCQPYECHHSSWPTWHMIYPV